MLGEYTISSLLLFNTFAVYIQQIGKTQAYSAAALAILSFGLTWLAMLGIFFSPPGGRVPRECEVGEWPGWTHIRHSTSNSG